MSALHPATISARHGAVGGDPHGATSAPLYQTATFAQEDPTSFGAFDYTRTDNPTRAAVESVLAELEGATHALTYSSGMAAIASVLRLARPGARVLCGRDLYGGTQRFAHAHLPGVDVRHVPLDVSTGDDLSALKAELSRGDVRLVFVETPSNPRLEIVDLVAVGRAAREAGALLVVDGTAMTPWLQTPLQRGADIVVHSGTKGLGGHGDVTAGVLATSDASLADELFRRRNAEGTALAPFESWLLLRGLRTLGVRVEQAQRTAAELARCLVTVVGVERVLYPGLCAHPGACVHAAQSRRGAGDSGGVLLTLQLPSAEAAVDLARHTRLFTTAVSFGGVASSISIPHYMSHASVPDGAAPRPDPTLVRLSIGLEALADLSADLLAALPGSGSRGPRRGDVARGHRMFAVSEGAASAAPSRCTGAAPVAHAADLTDP